MNGGSRIIGLRQQDGRHDYAGVTDGDGLADFAPDFMQSAAPDPAPDMPRVVDDASTSQNDYYQEPVLDEDASPSAVSRLLPVLAVVVCALWVAAMLWFALPALTGGMDAVAVAQFVAALCVPPALIGILWLLAMRTSRVEAARFGASARAMRAEAAELERAVAALTQRLDANRQELAEQARQLFDMGDSANDRLQAVSSSMAVEARAIETSAATLDRAANDTERKLATMLASLPRAQAETAEMAQVLEATGLLADQRVSALDAQLAALAERGREADVVAGGAAQRLAAHIARMEATSESAGARLEGVTESMSAAVDAVLDRAATAVDEARKGITAQGDAMLAMLQTNHAAIERAGRDGTLALAERIATIEAAIGHLAEHLDVRRAESESLIAALTRGVGTVEGHFERLHADGIERTQSLSASLSALTNVAGAMTEAMKTGDDTARRVIETAEGLLTALDAAAREMDETLPDALTRLDDRIGATRSIVAESKPELLALVTAAESTHQAIEAIAGVVGQQRDTLATVSKSLLETLDAGRDRIGGVQAIVDQTVATTQRFADQSAPQLIESLARIRDSADAASAHARDTLAAVVPEAARRLEAESGEALSRAVDQSVARRVADLRGVADEAVQAAADAAERLSQHMATLADTTTTLEQRIADERSDREAATRDSFARRVSLLIEAMNSAAIDITRAFSQEVSDSAWTAYLKGDRGVFTRRAVRLIDAGQAREIADLYDTDDAFRDQVNRYIHDFEAMLRHILGLREGSSLGVTLLSSDMGKLYVALAQAIERLRT